MEIVEHSNRLINESSPYLLQHAHNPVDWYPWGDEAFRRAKAENKLVLVSIGYSSCHWCHVMEKESFEDENIASLMNANFVCIKVDREEHPDVDHVYMDAVQILTGSGGWPLNCFTLPDGRPIYGGTYFRKKDWENILLRLSNLYKSTPEQAIRQAEQLYEGISITGIPKSFVTEDVNYKDIIDKSFPKIHSGFDTIEGGFKGHPKFPLPVVWSFIFDYQIFTGDNLVADQLILTLDNMALGGLYDQLGGGFARYSTDSHWLVPHFEKMLYDNAQLVSLYSKVFQRTNNKLYKKIVDETLLFVKRELSGPDGGFYSSYDADSIEGEGAYYVWTKREIDDLLGENSGWFCNLFNISEEGNWEGKNILYLKSSEYKLLKDEDKRKITECMAVLFQEREKRTKPELDDKIITSWNCLMINAFIDAYNAFENEEYLKTAEKNVDFILNRLMSDNITLYRIYKKGNKKIPAFLDDYAFLINSLIQLYQATFEEKWIIKARELTNQVISVFMDEEDGLFFYTDEKRDLPVRKKELQDSVIPSSNSVMAENLFFLSSFFESKVYKGVYVDMIKKLQENIKSFPRYYSNWLNLCLLLQQSSVEVVITGKEAMKVRKEILPYLKPNHILAGTISESKFPLLHLRHVEDKTLIYVCTNQVCSMPVDNVKEAISLLSDNSGKVNI